MTGNRWQRISALNITQDWNIRQPIGCRKRTEPGSGRSTKERWCAPRTVVWRLSVPAPIFRKPCLYSSSFRRETRRFCARIRNCILCTMICRADITGVPNHLVFLLFISATVFWGFSDIPDRKLKINLTTNLSIWFIRMTGAT